MRLDIPALKNWFLEQQRDLPWRGQVTPYAVWISEVMLQQTQVAVVIPFFLRWMQRFPTIETLAAANIDEVIKMWEGLGYYSRARHLHAGAHYIISHFDGELPQTERELKQIKGLGPYTIGAILSFAFHQKKAAVDGNVLRVLTRYCGIEDDIAKSSTIKRIHLLAESLLPDEESWLINEGLIELGATVCQKKARCSACPLKYSCHSHLHGTAQQLPVKSKNIPTTALVRAVAIIQHDEHYLVKGGQEGEIMRDLYEFPFFEMGVEDDRFLQLQHLIKVQFKLDVHALESLKTIKQSFTRYRACLYPIRFRAQERKTVAGLQWRPLADLRQLAFSAGHRRILALLGD